MIAHPVCGTIFGTLMNDPKTLVSLGSRVNEAPYKQPPAAPIFYIKPRNTWVYNGEDVILPADVNEVEVGANVGMVIGRRASKVSEQDAMDYVSGFVILNDVSVPHASYYRPALRFKACDTFCPISAFTPREQIASVDSLYLEVTIDGTTVQKSNMNGFIRPSSKLLSHASSFMTLFPGDVLSLGVPFGAPKATAGQRVCITVPGLGVLKNTLTSAEVSK